MNLDTINQLLRYYGPSWIVYRAWKSTSEKLGYWKYKLPSRNWEHFSGPAFCQNSEWDSPAEFFQWRKQQGSHFFFDPAGLEESRSWLSSLDPVDGWADTTQKRILDGEFPYFSSRWFDIGTTPDWFLNPYTRKSGKADGHFSQINEFGFGDIKALWEVNRFSWVFYLVRSYGRTGDEQAAEKFWTLLEDWMSRNTPYEGINWKCGQESSMRFLAAVFGLFAFSQSPATTQERLQMFVQLAAATGNRVEKHIGYAISQKNNHGISEAVLLITIGLLFPEMKRAAYWRSRGHQVLLQLCNELIYSDGAFSQHSANYHRLVLQLLAWTHRLADVNDFQLDPSITSGFHAATRFISNLIVGDQGHVPRYGNDDGALLLPLTHAEYFDFRPTVQLCTGLLDRQRKYGAGCWDESLFWFGLPLDEPEPTVPPHVSPGRKSFPEGGYHRIQKGDTAVFVRAGKFRHRPTQSDMMHVDLWWKNHNIALDPGTYSYNGEGLWKNIPLVKNQHHNSITVDGKEPENRVAKFLLLPWNQAERVTPKTAPQTLAMEWKRELTYGLESKVIHHRVVSTLASDAMVVLDGIWASQEHDYQLSWLFGGELETQDKSGGLRQLRFGADEYWSHIRCSSESQTDSVRGCESSARGWYAPHYLELQPALSCLTVANGNNLVFISIFAPLEKTVQKYSEIELTPTPNPECLLDSDLMNRIIQASIV